ncbi:MAG TPA: alpha/beta hydrolase [Candidatus Binatia bacterium]|nr:alpha/beta hydrolase [Candidatus Binatia bacterium]
MTTRTMLMVLAAALAAGCVTHFHDTPPPAMTLAGKPGHYTVTPNCVFTPPDWPAELQADIYTPAGAGPFPAVLVVHGGGWFQGSREEMNHIARALARRGFVAVNIDYRLAPQWRHPAPVDDLRAALHFMQQQAGPLQIDASRIGVWGYSAGAQLAALVAATGAESHSVQAAVLGAMPADLVRGGEENNPFIQRYIGQAYVDAPDLYREASPSEHVSPALPPVFLYNGTWDQIVNPHNTRDIHLKLSEAGVPNEWFVMHGYGHVTAFMFDGSAVDAGLAFLERRMSRPELLASRERRAASFAAAEFGAATGASAAGVAPGVESSDSPARVGMMP